MKRATLNTGRVAALAASAWLMAGLGPATAADLKDQVRQLLDASAKSTPPAVAAVRTRYETLQRAAKGDRRIAYAYGVALLNQHQYRDGATAIEAYLAAGPGEPHAYCAQVWAYVQLRRYGDAMAAAEKLAEHFPQVASEQPEVAWQDAAEFLGTIFGYLELARPTERDASARAEHAQHVLAGLGPAYTPAYRAGHGAVAAELSRLKQAGQAAADKATAAAESRKEQAQQELSQRRLRAADDDEKLQASTEKARNSRRAIEMVEQQLATLAPLRSQVAAQIVAAQTQLGQAIMPRGADPRDRRTAITIDTNVIDILQGRTIPARLTGITPTQVAQANAILSALMALNQQALELDRKIVDLQTRAMAHMQSGERELFMARQRDAMKEHHEKQARSLEKTIARAEADAAPRAPGLGGKAAMLSTYAPFPFADERRRVLAWFD